MQYYIPLFLYYLIFSTTVSYSQSYPVFGPEKEVTINGLTFDAMEPFISPDGNTLFFNSLNSGGNTNLYYATRINDTTFTFIGLVNGTYDSSSNHLDAVASLDSLNNFYWVSLRGYPASMENYHKGNYSGGNVLNTKRVYGNFNIYTFNYPFGWLIMDAAINYQGNLLYYCNALFDFSNTTCVGIPCESKLGIAQKQNDSTFNTISNYQTILSNINDTNYLVYAPQVTKDESELYFTRLLKGSVNTEICVSVRNSISDNFSTPVVIHSNNGYFPEAATISLDKQKIYYHQKNSSQLYKIFMRYRTGSSGIDKLSNFIKPRVYPNPAKNNLNIDIPDYYGNFTIEILDATGQEIMSEKNCSQVNLSGLAYGIYFVKVIGEKEFNIYKILKE